MTKRASAKKAIGKHSVVRGARRQPVKEDPVKEEPIKEEPVRVQPLRVLPLRVQAVSEQNASPLPRVSICTVTYNRARFLPLLQQHILNQTYPRDRMEWVLVDDSDDQQAPFIPNQAMGLAIRHERLSPRLMLGKKRNYSHSLCSGDIIVYMDDDDYYPPTRVAHAVERLMASQALVAGSTIMPILFIPEMELWVAGPYGKNHATAGTFAFKREYLLQAQFDDTKAFAEEKSFLKDYQTPMVQLDPNHTILCIAHDRNTFEKRRLKLGGQNPRFKRVQDAQTAQYVESLAPILQHYTSLLTDSHQPSTKSEQTRDSRPQPQPQLQLKALSIQKPPQVSLCTVTDGDTFLLPVLLRQILAQAYPRELIEWVIVDDDSSPEPDFIKDQEQRLGIRIKYARSRANLSVGERYKLAFSMISGDLILGMDVSMCYSDKRVSHAIQSLSASGRLFGDCHRKWWFSIPSRQYCPPDQTERRLVSDGSWACDKKLLLDARFLQYLEGNMNESLWPLPASETVSLEQSQTGVWISQRTAEYQPSDTDQAGLGKQHCLAELTSELQEQVSHWLEEYAALSGNQLHQNKIPVQPQESELYLSMTGDQDLREPVQISVICSVYNGAEFLPAYLDSVNAQVLPNFEIVFLDAASADKSVEIIRNFQFRNGIRAKLIRSTEKIGIYEAWNKAILAANGAWMINYNVDDRLFPEALATLSAVAYAYPQKGLIYSPCFISREPNCGGVFNYCDWRDANLAGSLEKGCCCGPFPLVNSRCFAKVGLFNTSLLISGDYEMWCRIKRAGFEILKIQTPIGIYYQNPKGLSTNPETQERRAQEDLIARQSLL